MNGIRLILTGILTLWAAFFLQAQEDSWKKAKAKDGITVYTRSTDSARVKEFRATTVLHCSLEEAIGMIMDVERQVEWTADVDEARILARPEANEIILYTLTKLPFPFSDRELIQSLRLVRDPAQQRADIYIRGLPDYLPPHKKHVRIPQARGRWELVQEDANTVRARFTFLADPGGKLPVWVVNLFVVDSPYKSLSQLRALLE